MSTRYGPVLATRIYTQRMTSYTLSLFTWWTQPLAGPPSRCSGDLARVHTCCRSKVQRSLASHRIVPASMRQCRHYRPPRPIPILTLPSMALVDGVDFSRLLQHVCTLYTGAMAADHCSDIHNFSFHKIVCMLSVDLRMRMRRLDFYMSITRLHMYRLLLYTDCIRVWHCWTISRDVLVEANALSSCHFHA